MRRLPAYLTPSSRTLLTTALPSELIWYRLSAIVKATLWTLVALIKIYTLHEQVVMSTKVDANIDAVFRWISMQFSGEYCRILMQISVDAVVRLILIQISMHIDAVSGWISWNCNADIGWFCYWENIDANIDADWCSFGLNIMGYRCRCQVMLLSGEYRCKYIYRLMQLSG